MSKKIIALITVSFLLYGFERENKTVFAEKGENEMATATEIKLSSTAFKDGQMMHAMYTCDGQNVSPPLKWEHSPQNTQSFALIMDDPDAPMGTYVHWVMWNIPADTNELQEDVLPRQELANGAKQGFNSSKKVGYTGPCPPSGTHRYYFKLYALDTMLKLESDTTKQKLLSAMEGHILAESQLMGRYQRK